MIKKFGFTLAEVSMAKRMSGKECLHSISRVSKPKEPVSKIKRLAAFTLAEVLITLAIIGVVAALTIPTLMVSYQKKMYVTQLKKEYNYLSNGLKTYMANENVDKITETTLWSMANSQNVDEIAKEMQRIFKATNFYIIGMNYPDEYKIKYKTLDGNDEISSEQIFPALILLADGSHITLGLNEDRPKECGESACKTLKEFQEYYQTPTKFYSDAGRFFLDINGLKGPNIIGRDVFLYDIGSDGVLYPVGGKDYAVYYSCQYNSLNSCNSYWKNDSGDGNEICMPNSSGLGCAGRIMEEGWEMKY